MAGGSGDGMSWLAPKSPELVWFTGPDAVRFLNDIVSQEIGAMGQGDVRRSLLLNVKGKLDHILWVLRGDDQIGLLTDTGRGEELAATLGRYRIRVDVAIEVETRPLWVVIGEERRGWAGGRDGPLEADISWRTTPRALFAGASPEVELGSIDDYELARISSGEPCWGVDVDEGTIPQEMDLVDLTVDFDKGCFLGQEVVGRIQHRGHVNRLLRILDIEGTAAPGDQIVWDGKEVGSVSSVSGPVGLGMVRREVPVSAVVGVGSAPAVVRAVRPDPPMDI
jgi:folate-binding protein YgfZ